MFIYGPTKNQVNYRIFLFFPIQLSQLLLFFPSKKKFLWPFVGQWCSCLFCCLFADSMMMYCGTISGSDRAREKKNNERSQYNPKIFDSTEQRLVRIRTHSEALAYTTMGKIPLRIWSQWVKSSYRRVATIRLLIDRATRSNESSRCVLCICDVHNLFNDQIASQFIWFNCGWRRPQTTWYTVWLTDWLTRCNAKASTTAIMKNNNHNNNIDAKNEEKWCSIEKKKKILLYCMRAALCGFGISVGKNKFILFEFNQTLCGFFFLIHLVFVCDHFFFTGQRWCFACTNATDSNIFYWLFLSHSAIRLIATI